MTRTQILVTSLQAAPVAVPVLSAAAHAAKVEWPIDPNETAQEFYGRNRERQVASFDRMLDNEMEND